jgi:hypothetical protein
MSINNKPLFDEDGARKLQQRYWNGEENGYFRFFVIINY